MFSFNGIIHFFIIVKWFFEQTIHMKQVTFRNKTRNPWQFYVPNILNSEKDFANLENFNKYYS